MFSIKTNFYILIILFTTLMISISAPAIGKVIGFGLIYLGLLFSFFGIQLLLKIRNEPSGKLKNYFFMTGMAAAAFVFCVILHNVFYGLAILVAEIAILPAILNVLEAIFFLIAIIVCPVMFGAGAVGAIFHTHIKPSS